MQLSLHPINNYIFFRFQLFLSVCQYDHHFPQNLKILSLLLWETEWLIGDDTTVAVTVMGSNSFTCSVPSRWSDRGKKRIKNQKRNLPPPLITNLSCNLSTFCIFFTILSRQGGVIYHFNTQCNQNQMRQLLQRRPGLCERLVDLILYLDLCITNKSC